MKRHLLLLGMIMCLIGNTNAQFTNEILNTSFANLPTVSSSSSTLTNGTGAATGYSWIRTTINNTTTTWPYFGVPGATNITTVVTGTSTSTCYIEFPALTFINGGTVYVEYGSGSNREYELVDATSGSAVSTGISGGNGTTANRFQVDNSAAKPRSTILNNTFTLSATDFNGSKKLRIVFVGGSDSRLFKVVVKTSNPGTPPTVSTTTATAITGVSATSGGNVTAEGDASVTAKGVVWNTSAVPTVALTSKTNDGTGMGSFVSAITPLTYNTKYYYRAYATSSIGTAYGAENNFTTSPATPTSTPANNITLTGFNANWTAPTQGSETFTYTLEYSTDNTFATGVTSVSSISSANTSQAVSGLTSGATYYYRVTTVNATGSSTASAIQTVVLVDGSLATDYFRTFASGNWNVAATWQSSHDNINWNAATSGPDNNASAIQISGGHTVTITATTGANNLTVDATAIVSINAGSVFTIANGTGTDVTLNGTIKNIGTFTLASGATMNVGATGIYEDAQAVTTGTITIPTATWATGSTFILSGLVGVAATDYIGLQGVKQSFSNFKINTPNLLTKLLFTRNGGTSAPYMEITGTLTVDATGTGSGIQILSTGNNNNTLVVGNYVQNGGNVQALHNASSNATRNFTVLGDFSLNNNSVFDIANTTGTSATNITYTNIGGNLSVASTATLQRTQAAAGPVAAIQFNGTAQQNITSGLTVGTPSYIINNAAGVTLNNDLTINGVLTFTSGKVTTGSNKIVVSSTGSISGGGTGWVIGNLQKAVAAAASAVSFEIGGTDAYRPIALSFTTPITTGGDITTSVSQTAGDHPNISGSGLNVNKSVNRYWTITNNGLVNADYAATITFDASDVDAGATTSNFIVKKYDGSAWSAPTTGTKTATSIQLSETSALAASSQFAIGEASTLPVTISGFKGEVLASANKLQWTTSTETNNKGFEVERSLDGRVFTSIAFVNTKADKGNSNTIISYSFDDLKPFAGINYYRLKQVDNDGKSTTSGTILLTRTSEKISITRVYPNPATTDLTVVITSPKNEEMRMIISDMMGKIIVNANMNVQSGANKQNINTANFAPGTYTIKFVCAEGCETLIQHFIKQ